MASSIRLRTHAKLAPTIGCALLSLAVLAGCGSDGTMSSLTGGATVQAAATPVLSQPETVTTEAAPAEPTPTNPPAEPVDTAAPGETTPDRDITIIAAPDDDNDDTNWLWIALLIGLGIAILALIAYLIGSRKPAPAHRTAPAAAVASPALDLLNTSQWIHDQFSLQLLAATPPTALARWSAERSRLDGVAIGAHQLYLEGGGDMWQRLEQIMSLLATSIDTNVQLRAQDPPSVQLIAESANVVNGHRATLQQAINVLRSSLPR